MITELRPVIFNPVTAELITFIYGGVTSATTSESYGNRAGWVEYTFYSESESDDAAVPLATAEWVLGENIWYKTLQSRASGQAYYYTVPSEERYTTPTTTTWSTVKSITYYATDHDYNNLGTIATISQSGSQEIEYFFGVEPAYTPTLDISNALSLSLTAGSYTGPLFRTKIRMEYTASLTCTRSVSPVLLPYQDSFVCYMSAIGA